MSTNNYPDILALLKDETIANSIDKAEIYRKLLNIATYYNGLYPIERNSLLDKQQYYIITKEGASTLCFKYKDLDVWIESKGFENDIFYIKKKLFRKYLDNKLEKEGIKSIFFEVYTKNQLLQALDIIKEYTTNEE